MSPETTIDRMMLVYALSRVPSLGRVQMQKCMFKAALDTRGTSSSPSMRFIRYTHGPFTKDLYEHVGSLQTADLVTCGQDFDFTQFTALTDRGRALARWTNEVLSDVPGWDEARQALDEAASFVNPKSASFLENWSHEIVLAPEGTADPVRIHDMPNGTIIMAPRDRADWAPLSVPEEILIDFEIACLYSDEDVQHFKMRAAAGTLEELLAV